MSTATQELSAQQIAVNSQTAIAQFQVTIKPTVTVTVPAGDYILGDPCYTVPNDAWDELLDSCDCFQGCPVGTVLGHQVLAFSTAYGDGIYRGKDGHEYAVDAGLIGLVPVSMPGISVAGEYTTWPPRRISFGAPTECWNDKGILHFGLIVIKTR